MNPEIFRKFLLILFITTSLTAQKSSWGLIPLTELGASFYKNFQGGLYPGGYNTRPVKHDSIGIELSKKIKPLDKNGNMDTLNGKYVFLSIGMSNTTQEFTVFKTIADVDPDKNQKLVIVDGAQGGQTAAIISNPSANFWSVIEQRLQQTGVTSKQVAVCWIKEADANPTQPFPVHANTLTNELVAIVKNIKEKYPNYNIAYLSSRTYGGYALTTLNPEPYAYESGFSVKWLIEKQINNDSELTCVGDDAKSPWLSWGPYLWADGINQRSDGLIWLQTDFRSDDGTHPSDSGKRKVADLLLNFLKTDKTARNWFLKNSISNVREDILPQQDCLYQNYPNPFNPTTTISYQLLEKSFVTIKIYDILGKEIATLVNEDKPAGYHTVTFDSGQLNRGQVITSGVYIYTLYANGIVQSKKMLLAK